MNHLTEEEIADIADHWRAGGSPAMHLEQCRACRQALGTHVLQSGLMRPGTRSAVSNLVGTRQVAGALAAGLFTARGGGHLDAKQIRALHAAAFEGEEMASVPFISSMWHLKTCDVCLANFEARHQDLTPSAELLDAAIAMFWRGRAAVSLGVLTIFERKQTVSQQFEPASTGVVQVLVSARGTDRGQQGGSNARAGFGRRLASLIHDPWKRFREAVGEALSPGRWIDRIRRPGWFRKHPSGTEPSEVGPDAPMVIKVTGVVLQMQASRVSQRLTLRVQLSAEDSGLPIAGASLVSLDASGAAVAQSLTDDQGFGAVDLLPTSSAVRFELGVGYEPWVLGLRHSTD